VVRRRYDEGEYFDFDIAAPHGQAAESKPMQQARVSVGSVTTAAAKCGMRSIVIIIELSYRYRDNFDLSYRLSIENSILHIVTALVPRNESSTGAKVLSMVFSLPRMKVQRNEKTSYRVKCEVRVCEVVKCEIQCEVDCDFLVASGSHRTLPNSN